MAGLAAPRADTLSGGQQQRVAIARALVQEPDIILADEPIASLDPRNTKVVMDSLLRINKHFGITVVCNLHSLDTARAYCDRLVGMAQGRVVFDGVPEALTDDVARELYGLDAGEVMDTAGTRSPAGEASVRLRIACRRRNPRPHQPSQARMIKRRSPWVPPPVPWPSACPALAQDWKAKYPEIVVAIVPAENASGVRSLHPVRRISVQGVGTKVTLRVANDYTAVIEGQRNGSIHLAGYVAGLRHHQFDPARLPSRSGREPGPTTADTASAAPRARRRVSMRFLLDKGAWTG